MVPEPKRKWRIEWALICIIISGANGRQFFCLWQPPPRLLFSASSARNSVLDQSSNITSNFIFGAILIAFIIYITAKGELGSYLQMFLYQPPAPQKAQAQTPATGGSPATPSTGPGLFSGSGGIFAPFQFFGGGVVTPSPTPQSGGGGSTGSSPGGSTSG